MQRVMELDDDADIKEVILKDEASAKAEAQPKLSKVEKEEQDV